MVELRLSLVSYQDHHMLLLTLAARWNSMVSLVDVGAGLWPYAHNGSRSTNTSNPGLQNLAENGF